jgi:TRAP-type C4-dicarboxylate transport system permease large subunit
MLTPPMLRAGYKPEHAASLVVGHRDGILVPPAIFMIVLGQVMDASSSSSSSAASFRRTATCLMVVILCRRIDRLAKDERPTWASLSEAGARWCRSWSGGDRPRLLLRRLHRDRSGAWWRRTRWPPRSSTTAT